MPRERCRRVRGGGPPLVRRGRAPNRGARANARQLEVQNALQVAMAHNGGVDGQGVAPIVPQVAAAGGNGQGVQPDQPPVPPAPDAIVGVYGQGVQPPVPPAHEAVVGVYGQGVQPPVPPVLGVLVDGHDAAVGGNGQRGAPPLPPVHVAAIGGNGQGVVPPLPPQHVMRNGGVYGQEVPAPLPPQQLTSDNSQQAPAKPHVAWIVGSSIPFWAEKRAKRRSSSNLGLEGRHIKVRWITRRGMMWNEVLPLVESNLRAVADYPDVILIHCGGNSIVNTPKARLISKIKFVIKKIWDLTNEDVPIIWSNILPRLSWGAARSVHAVERTRKAVNRIAARAALYGGGAWLKNIELTMDCPGLFRQDGVHLSDIGLDILLSSFKEVIEYCVYLEDDDNRDRYIFD